ncbi:MAG TPA: S8 family serine peptidase, partial [Gaiellaceae bacterium]|nr:S8 family serine peptidase [Gaiellaceae bacterium]
MIGARLRKTALLATVAGAIACCPGASDGFASRGIAPPGASTLAGQAGARSNAPRVLPAKPSSARGPAVETGPVTASRPTSAAVPVGGDFGPQSNGSVLRTTQAPAAAAGEAHELAAASQSYTNPWRYCPGDIQLGVSDGLGCDEWWLAPSYVDSGVTHYGMDAVGAWQTTMGQGVTIGLLSSGADTNDPDYADNLASGGYNFVDGDTDTNDTYGTGTVLTGIMAAEPDNGGFVGVAPASKVLEVKVLGPYGTLTDSAVSQGITYAVGHGASVIAFPLYEIGASSGYLPLTQAALNATANQNVVVALASGDLGSSTQGVQNGTPGYLISPDGSKLSNTITVASEDYLNNFDQFTDSGAGVQIAAPGTSLFGDYPDNWPSGGWISGSESAAGEVAAVAALLRSAFPTATATQVVQAILSGGRPLPSLQGMVSCGCMLSASGAMSALAQVMHVAPVVHTPPASQPTPTSPTYDNGSGAFWGDCSIPTAFNDPRADCEWYIPATYSETGYYGGTHDGIDLTDAWKQTTGAGVEVATVDTGAAPNPDFASQLVPGWNFWDGNSDTTDVVYHGTYTASLIAAQPNNSMGIVGAAPDATLMPVKVLGPNEEWVNSNIVAGVNYAVNSPGVRAVNISLAGLNSPVPGIQDAMQNAENKSVLLVFAAGNWGADHDNPQYVPSFDGTGFDNVLTVAATTHWNTIAFFSDYGPQHVDIAAPGEGIAMDTIDGSDNATSYGTSFAAPLVTGVAALLFSAYPQATAAQVKEAICNGATQLPQLMSKVRCGLLNAEGALQALAALLAAPQTAAPADVSVPTTDAGGAPTVGQTVHATTGTWTNSPTSYAYQWQSSTNGTTWTSATGAGATTSSYTVASADAGDYL